MSLSEINNEFKEILDAGEMTDSVTFYSGGNSYTINGLFDTAFLTADTEGFPIRSENPQVYVHIDTVEAALSVSFSDNDRNDYLVCRGVEYTFLPERDGEGFALLDLKRRN